MEEINWKRRRDKKSRTNFCKWRTEKCLVIEDTFQGQRDMKREHGLQIFSFSASKYFAFCVNWILSIQHVGFVVGFNCNIIVCRSRSSSC